MSGVEKKKKGGYWLTSVQRTIAKQEKGVAESYLRVVFPDCTSWTADESYFVSAI
jgi:hypothetical protein